MVRSTGAVIAGLLVMLIVVAAIQWLGHSVYPPPEGLDFRDKDAVAAAVALLLAGAWLSVRGGRGSAEDAPAQ